jgi:hypothetical protein
MLQAALLPEFSRLAVSKERKLCIVAMTLLLTSTQCMKTEHYFPIWPKVMSGIIDLLRIESEPTSTLVVADEDLEDLEEKGYQASFAKLATVGNLSKSEQVIHQNVREYVSQRVTLFMKTNAEFSNSMIQGLTLDNQQYVRTHLMSM